MKKHHRQKSPPYFLYLIIYVLLIYSCYITSAYLNVTDKSCYKEQTYYIHSGDTLWSIGQRYCSNTDDVREWVDRVMDINDMKSADIITGTEITILVDSEE